MIKVAKVAIYRNLATLIISEAKWRIRARMVGNLSA